MKLERVIIVLVMLWSGTGLAAIEHPAQTLVEDSIAKVLQILSENSERIKTDQAFILETIDTHISPGLDFNSMTKLALGKNWKTPLSFISIQGIQAAHLPFKFSFGTIFHGPFRLVSEPREKLFQR